MTAASHDISIVIVNRNTRELLRECLAAIAAQQDVPGAETIVVDNGSDDGSVEMVHDAFTDVRVIANEENVGYAHANNQGIEASDGACVLLINSDAVLSTRALRSLQEFVEADPRVGAAGVRLLNTDGSLQRLQRGRTLSLGSTVNQMLLLSNAFPRTRALQGFHVESDFDRPEPIGWVSTACALFRREALDDAGVMDEGLVTYGTDLDLCTRIGSCGWSVYSAPIDVVHHGGASFPDGARSTMWFRSLHQLYARDHHRMATAVFDFLIAIGFALRAIAHLTVSLTGRPEHRGRAAAAWKTSLAAGRAVLLPGTTRAKRRQGDA